MQQRYLLQPHDRAQPCPTAQALRAGLHLSALCAALLIAHSSHAQTLPTPNPKIPAPEQTQRNQEDQAEQRRQRERSQTQNQQLQPSVDIQGPSSTAADTRLPANESPCFVINQVNLNASAGPLLDVVTRALNGPQGDDSPLRKCLGTQGISLLIKRAQDSIVGQGWVTSRALTQPQDLSQGSLNLTLVPGRINAIRLAPNEAGSSPARIHLDNAIASKSGDILNLRDIEQGLENLKRVPGTEADIQIEPASANAPDQSDLVVRYQNPRPARINLSLDDSGSKTSGVYQGSATVSLDNPLALSDLFYLTLNHDLNTLGHPKGDPGAGPRGTQGHTLHYSLPAGYWTLAFNHSESTYYQSVAGANANYTYSGQSDTSDIKLGTIVYRDAQAKTSLGLKAWVRNSKNFVDDAEIEVQRRNVAGWELSLGHKTQIGSTTLDANLSYKRGTDDFGAQPAPEEYNQTDPNTGTARFGLSTLDASASGAFTLGSSQWNYSSALHLQNASTALTTMDRISIGGRSSVRGFDGESSLSAERGYTLRNELSLGLGQSGQQIYLGVDYGEVSGPSSADLLGRSLSGAVLGLRGELQPGYGKLQYDLFVGGPLNRPEGFKTAQTTAGFSLNWGL